MKKMILLGVITLAVSLIIIGCDSKPKKKLTKKSSKTSSISKTMKTGSDEEKEPPKLPEPQPIVVQNPVTMTTTSGLQYVDTMIGVGEEATSGSTVWVHYTGWLADGGKKFDSSVDRGKPYPFTVGVRRVIKGWDEGVCGMKVGGKRKLIVPPNLGYGEQDKGVIPPNSTLIFELELIKVQQ
ncbi:MAG: FKBP-type peptidyl-prolyl cis-trans isomerase [Planctomycetota bacterium]